jgi:hypothetical protein
MSAVVEGVIVCGARQSRCICILPPHEPEVAHECNPDVCGGSWRIGADGEFEILRLPEPGGIRTGRALSTSDGAS